jgi:hypothetical protein
MLANMSISWAVSAWWGSNFGEAGGRRHPSASPGAPSTDTMGKLERLSSPPSRKSGLVAARRQRFSGERAAPAPRRDLREMTKACSPGERCHHCPRMSVRRRLMKMTVGVLDHYNVSTRKEAAKRHLSEMRVLYHVNQVPNSARWQIFLRDPNNVEIELNFESKNEAGI